MRSFASKAERNAALFADYLKGYSRKQAASKYGLSLEGVNALLVRHGVTLPPSERARRSTEGRRKAGYKNVGRKRCWPDCPAALVGEFAVLKRYMPVAEARATLEGQRT